MNAAGERGRIGVQEILLPIVGLILFAVFVASPELQAMILHALFPDARDILYGRAPLSVLVGQHLLLAGTSSLAAAAAGILLGIAVTRPAGKAFRPPAEDAISLLQTFPPVAVLALSVPILGFGFRPAFASLVLFSILPIMNNTIAGIASLPPDIREAAVGMGMTDGQILFRIELPMALRVIIAGLRISLVINVGTATVGAVVGAGGLGVPIVAGLSRNNPAFIFQGAVSAALLAVIVDRLLGIAERVSYDPHSP